MPIHDWTRASDAAFHHFQLGWAVELSRALNGGVLPSSHYAITETVDLRPAAGFLDLPEPDGPVSHRNRTDDLPDADEHPPRARFRATDDRRQYACRAVTVRDDLHQAVAAVLFVTRQDQETPYRRDALVGHAVGALSRGTHLLAVDLFPPPRRDPRGFHQLVWGRIRDEPFELPPDKPLTLAAYSAGTTITGYIEPVGVGDAMPDMPIFLTPDRYVPCPLEATYQASWDVFPKPLRGPLEAPPE
ncbi:MAG: hypothetical protein C0501_29585 [Isosphaera sp.]|nr:hypothetical protein [Isosphaera sp.]